MAQPDQDPGSLHDLAVDASTDIRKLAIGLAHAGAQPQAVQGLNKMAEQLDGVVKILAQSPEVESAAKGGVGAPQGGPAQPPQPGPPQAGPPPQPGQGGLAPGAPGGPPSGGAFGPATQALHHAMANTPPNK